MSDREVDQQLVERVQQGDKRAFDLLVVKYQRKLARLLSQLVRDPAEVEDIAQETFIKAYRALPFILGYTELELIQQKIFLFHKVEKYRRLKVISIMKMLKILKKQLSIKKLVHLKVN